MYEISSTAQLQANLGTYLVQASLTHPVTATYLVLGQTVHAGDVLVMLESGGEVEQLTAETERLAVLEEELSLFQQAVVRETDRLATLQSNAQTTLDTTNAKAESIETSWQEAQAFAQELANKDTAVSDLLQAQTLAQQRENNLTAFQIALLQLQQSQQTVINNQRNNLDQLEHQVIRLKTDIALAKASVAQLTHLVADHQIVAPVSGVLAEIADLKPGMVVKQGDTVAKIVTTPDLFTIEARFPAKSLGRIAVGQAAWMRVDSYPWAQYGILPARVWAVAADTTSNQLQVQFVVNGNGQIPLQNGLVGQVEVAVEQVSPADFVWRAVQTAVTNPTTALPNLPGALPTPPPHTHNDSQEH